MTLDQMVDQYAIYAPWVIFAVWYTRLRIKRKRDDAADRAESIAFAAGQRNAMQAVKDGEVPFIVGYEQTP